MAIHDIPANIGILAGLCISLALYGMYCVLFSITIYTRRRCNNKSYLITCAVVALFVMCSIIMALHISVCYRKLIQLPSTNPTTKVFFVDPLQPHQEWYPVKDVLLLCSNLVAEALLVWRLYMIWSKNWKIIIAPVIGIGVVACGGIVSSIIEFILFLSSTERARKLIPVFIQIAPIGWVATLCNNLLCTTLIIWKLWQISRTINGRGTAKLTNPAVSALIESGAFYTSTVLCMVILAETGMEGVNFVIVAVLPVVVGIAPTSIVLRLNLIAIQKPLMTIPNDISVIQSSPSSTMLSNFGSRNEAQLVTGITTIPEPAFARPRTDFTSFTSVDLSVDRMNSFETEIVHEKGPDSLIT